MNNPLDLLFLFFYWMLIDLIGLITFIKPVNEPRQWINRTKFKSFMRSKYSLISLGIELIGIILFISSFNVPWYYQEFIDINFGGFIRYFYIKDLLSLENLLTDFLFYAYLLGLTLLFVKISVSKKMRILTALELLELIVIIPGIMLMFMVNFPKYCFSVIPEEFCLKFGYTSGYISFISGTIVLILNGLQMSIHLRWKRNSK